MRISITRKKQIIVGVLLAMALAVGIYVIWSSQHPSDSRGIASSVDDEGQSLKVQLIQALDVAVVDDSVQIEFGAFESICAAGSEIEVVWRAEGIAIEGEVPEFKVTYPCENIQGGRLLPPLRVPLRQFAEVNEDAAEWHLVQVILYHPQHGTIVDVDGYEIHHIRSGPLVVQF